MSSGALAKSRRRDGDSSSPLGSANRCKEDSNERRSEERQLPNGDTDKSSARRGRSSRRRHRDRSSDVEEERNRSLADDNRRKSKMQKCDHVAEEKEYKGKAPRRKGANESVAKGQTQEEEELKEWIESKRSKAATTDLTKLGGGTYVPPAKLREMQEQNLDKNGMEYQRMAWDRLKKRIHGLVNRVNTGNIVQIIQELFKVNLIRAKGLFVQALITAQAFSEPYSHIMAALAAVVNSKFPSVGELLLNRLLDRLKRAYKRNDRMVSVASIKFIAHLINQQVAHEVLALEILTLLLENPTDDSVEIAVAFLKECGAKLTELTPVGMNAIFDRLRSILHEAEVETRVQFMIEVLFQIRKEKFANHPAIIEELDLVEEKDQITHAVSLDSTFDINERLNFFRFDPEFEKNELAYEEIRNEILEGESDEESGDENEADEDEAPADGAESATVITDMTESQLISFRRTVYLTIQSSLDFQEAIHKLLKMDFKPGYDLELCNMILDCCAQQRTYEKFFGLMAERFCRLKTDYQKHFENIFRDVYAAIHRFELTKLRNTARLFAHLLFTDAISWMCLQCIHLTENDTTSCSRIFIKVLFHELAEYMGLQELYERIDDATMQAAFEGLFPRDHPHNTRFAINFFTSIGLGGLTIGMREHLKSKGKQETVMFPTAAKEKEEESDEDESSASDGDSSSSSSSTESSSEDEKDNSPVASLRAPQRSPAVGDRYRPRGEDARSSHASAGHFDNRRDGAQWREERNRRDKALSPVDMPNRDKRDSRRDKRGNDRQRRYEDDDRPKFTFDRNQKSNANFEPIGDRRPRQSHDDRKRERSPSDDADHRRDSSPKKRLHHRKSPSPDKRKLRKSDRERTRYEKRNRRRSSSASSDDSVRDYLKTIRAEKASKRKETKKEL